jgi:hypothetical protein
MRHYRIQCNSPLMFVERCDRSTYMQLMHRRATQVDHGCFVRACFDTMSCSMELFIGTSMVIDLAKQGKEEPSPICGR